MKAVYALLIAGVIVLAGPARTASAADKEHRQIMAEIRMLQEQQQQLQQMIGGLTDALKAVSTKLDDQAAANRKALADQGLQLNGVADGIRILREKLDDSNVRISSLAQEIEGVRQTLASQPSPSMTMPGTETPTGAPGTEPAPTEPGQQPGQPGQPGAAMPPVANPNPIPPGVSPQKMWDAAFADYSAGQYDLAVLGFESYIKAFPRSPQAAAAQLYIGHARQQQSNWPEALKAYQAVIDSYPDTSSAPEAYYKLGQTYERMNQLDAARKAYQTTIDKFPNSNGAIFAKQSLERLSRREEAGLPAGRSIG